MNTRNGFLYASIGTQIHQDGRVVAGRLTFTFVPDDLRVGDPARQRRGGEDEVDAHSLSLREPQLGVIPVGVYPGTWSERPYHICELSIDDGVKRFALRFRHMGGALEEFDAPDVIVGRGGSVALPLQRDRTRRIEISAAKDGPDVLIAVDDSGPGVAASVTARLFEPFVTSKASGMGLGLSLSRTLLRHQGGDLHCEPSHLGGARFVIRLTTRSNAPTGL